jgi:hypothetical protein
VSAPRRAGAAAAGLPRPCRRWAGQQKPAPCPACQPRPATWPLLRPGALQVRHVRLYQGSQRPNIMWAAVQQAFAFFWTLPEAGPLAGLSPQELAALKAAAGTASPGGSPTAQVPAPAPPPPRPASPARLPACKRSLRPARPPRPRCPPPPYPAEPAAHLLWRPGRSGDVRGSCSGRPHHLELHRRQRRQLRSRRP